MKAILAILLVFGLMLVGAGYKLPASSVHGNLNMTSHNIIGLAAPSNETDAATKLMLILWPLVEVYLLLRHYDRAN